MGFDEVIDVLAAGWDWWADTLVAALAAHHVRRRRGRHKAALLASIPDAHEFIEAATGRSPTPVLPVIR